MQVTVNIRDLLFVAFVLSIPLWYRLLLAYIFYSAAKSNRESMKKKGGDSNEKK